MITVIDHQEPKARKAHICDSCLREIAPGTKYMRQRCADGGEAWTWKAHLACDKAAQILWSKGREGYDGALLNVCDMDHEDREIVYAADPETFHTIWPDRPAPGQPKPVQ